MLSLLSGAEKCRDAQNVDSNNSFPSSIIVVITVSKSQQQHFRLQRQYMIGLLAAAVRINKFRKERSISYMLYKKIYLLNFHFRYMCERSHKVFESKIFHYRRQKCLLLLMDQNGSKVNVTPCIWKP